MELKEVTRRLTGFAPTHLAGKILMEALPSGITGYLHISTVRPILLQNVS